MKSLARTLLNEVNALNMFDKDRGNSSGNFYILIKNLNMSGKGRKIPPIPQISITTSDVAADDYERDYDQYAVKSKDLESLIINSLTSLVRKGSIISLNSPDADVREYMKDAVKRHLPVQDDGDNNLTVID